MEKAELRLDVAISREFRFSNIRELFPDDLKQLIIKYIKDTVTIIITQEREEAIETDKFIIKPHILQLSPKLLNFWNDSQDYLQPIRLTSEETQVGIATFNLIMEYLEHHDGKEPPALPCPIRTTDMHQVVSDPWDANFINEYNKKQIFEIILAANALDVQPLLHLGCAKIATLIKQLDQREINRIIEEEENYRRDNQLEAPQTSNTQPIQLNLNDNQNDQQSQGTQNTQNQDENDNSTQVDYAQEYRIQLESLASMGFSDEDKNLRALINSGGDLNGALDYLYTPQNNN